MVETYTKFLRRKHNIGKKVSIEDILKDYNINPNELMDAGFNLLHLAIQDEEEEIVQTILFPPEDHKCEKADPNIICSDKGWSPLIYAICFNP